MALTDENGGIGATMLVGPTGYGAAPYPVYQNNGGFGGGFGGDWGWIILLLLLAGGGWGMGGFGGFGGGMANWDTMWLLNGQNNTNNNVSSGFRDAQLHDSVTSVRDGIAGLSTQLCGCCADMAQTVNSGFANAETAANARQMANMQQNFALQSQFANCCCENRLGIESLRATVLQENCQDRYEAQNNTRDIIESQTRGTQTIIDKLCSLELAAKNDRISDLERQLTMANLAASQTAQTSRILADNAAQTVALEQYLNPVPVPAYVVQNPNCCQQNTCGCGGNVGGFNGNF